MTRTETIDLQHATISFNVEEGLVIEHENGEIVLDGTRARILTAIAAARQTPEGFVTLAPESTPVALTREIILIRNWNVRRHATYTAQVPEHMLADPRYFDDAGQPTSDFDQWMCDNGTESDVDETDLDDDDLSYEVSADSDYRECSQCEDSVLTLSSDDLCDGCVEENEGTTICPNCGERVDESDMSHWPNLTEPISMCSSCYHDARRSGWEPGQ